MKTYKVYDVEKFYIEGEEHLGVNKYWKLNNKLHRENGPAKIFPNGIKEYYLDDIYYPNIETDEELLLASIIT
jgi:hypothetical protein